MDLILNRLFDASWPRAATVPCLRIDPANRTIFDGDSNWTGSTKPLPPHRHPKQIRPKTNRSGTEPFGAALFKNERRERLILASRQVTSLSKKLIFHLHRISLIPRAYPLAPSTPPGSASGAETEVESDSDRTRKALFLEAEVKLGEIRDWLLKIGLELRDSEREATGSGGDGGTGSSVGESSAQGWSSGGAGRRTGAGVGGYWAYARNVSGGIQEFLESLSYLHFLRTGQLISLADVRLWMRIQERDRAGPVTAAEGQADEAMNIVGKGREAFVVGEEIFIVTSEEYAMGVSDLTGELMRYATNCSSSGDFETAIRVCAFVRDMKSGLDTSEPFVRDLNKKQAVTAQSLEKIEKICYAIQLRVMEYADRPDVLSHLTKRALEDQEQDSAQGGGGDDAGGGGASGGAGGFERNRGGGGRGRGGPRGGGARGGGAPRGGGRGGAAAGGTDDRPAKRQAVEVGA